MPNPSNPPTLGRRVLVYASLTLTIVLAFFLIVSTGIRWMTQRTPASIVIVYGGPATAGARVTAISDEGTESRSGTLPSTGEIVLPLFLPAGAYTLQVDDQNKPVYRTMIYVAAGQRYDVHLHPPAAQP